MTLSRLLSPLLVLSALLLSTLSATPVQAGSDSLLSALGIEANAQPKFLKADDAFVLAQLNTELPDGWADLHALDPEPNPDDPTAPVRPRLGPRTGLQLGKDVYEHDLWGLDCYTRQSILDVLGLCMPSPQERLAFLERRLMPAVQRQNENGWDIVKALQALQVTSLSASEALNFVPQSTYPLPPPYNLDPQCYSPPSPLRSPYPCRSPKRVGRPSR